MPDNVKGFIVLREFSTGIGLLSTMQKGRLMEALLADMESEPIPELDPVTNVVFHMMLPSVHAAQNAFSKKQDTARENGAKGGRPKKTETEDIDSSKNPKTNLVSEKPDENPKTNLVSENLNRIDGNRIEENFNITTPDGVVVDAEGVSPPTEPNSDSSAKEEMPTSGERLKPVPSSLKATKPAAPPCPHKQIVELYHEILPTLPRVKVWDSERERNMQARWRERWESGKYTTQEEGLAYWRRLFAYIHGCPWLMGEIADREGKAFRADLGWIILPRNFKKIIEGRYDQRQEVA